MLVCIACRDRLECPRANMQGQRNDLNSLEADSVKQFMGEVKSRRWRRYRAVLFRIDGLVPPWIFGKQAFRPAYVRRQRRRSIGPFTNPTCGVR